MLACESAVLNVSVAVLNVSVAVAAVVSSAEADGAVAVAAE